jgi:TPR repeat protein
MRQIILGSQYLHGDGVPQDKAQTARLLWQAAEQGIAGAQYKLCLC